MDKTQIEKMVREVLEKTLNESSQNIYQEANGVLSCKIESLKPQPFDTGKAGDKVGLIDAFTTDQSRNLGCGLMEMEATTFDWYLDYDEINYVIEGELHIIKGDKKVIAKKGEIIHTPKGSKIQFCVPEYAKFMYVTYPANWSE